MPDYQDEVRRAPARRAGERLRRPSEDPPPLRELVSRSWLIEETVFALRGVPRGSQHSQTQPRARQFDREIS